MINYDLSNVSETYIHRIGRTGRAEKSGIAWSFCDQDERPLLRDIEKLIQKKIAVITEHPFPDAGTDTPAKKPQKPKRPAQHQGRRSDSESSSSGSKKPKRRHYYPGKRR